MAANSALSAVTLRYWACRGRAEFIRCMLRDSGTAFSDERWTKDRAEDWPEQKRFVAVAGPFGMLPVLHWGDGSTGDGGNVDGGDEDNEVIVSQTLAIAQFLQLKLRPKEEQEAVKLTLAMALGCHVLEELYLPLLKMLWGQGASPQTYLTKILPERLLRLDAHLPEGGWLLAGDAPCWAEYLLFDTLQAIGEVFGREAVEGGAVLRGFLTRMAQRPALREYLMSDDRAETPITMAPGEAEIRAQISEALR
uniref:Glutathione transferase n=1 Tax=Tetraselmis chuii TaxID=63592 RepID=A0A7S1SSP6_9CHLO|mmetsp:Transcript_26077/g.46368  ORF Transcript_26077/g.46368 Transcript_26077/m.46368 type:complete len:251 (+) Transcript_26077:128-880(+)|eukprot:CAMPEP_0177756154 /NCGR_PEP_ID=MMETSP0491_2-20121128/2956_1 /TAXON_ID=63592 /ORGANISM="Tetraselmis chuii, Strain PLY429" /LENGTH=250 /DNA_ID=CAMNT_0019271715 /DNA_START=128 /DNA_END=880 /DNA_ORIENTATION=+